MDDIVFPPWVVTSPAFAFASILARSIIGETHRKDKPLQNLPLAQSAQNQGDLGGSYCDSKTSLLNQSIRVRDNVTKMQKSLGVEEDESDTSGTLSTSSVIDYNMPRERRARYLNRPSFSDQLMQDGRDADGTAPSGAQPRSLADARSAVSGSALLHMNRVNIFFPNFANDTGMLHDSRVQRLLRLSHLSELVHCKAHSKAATISAKHAAAITAFMAFTAECRHLPGDLSAGFYVECSSLFSTFVSRLRDYNFCEGMDIKGFVAAIIACGLCLRNEDPLNHNDTGNIRIWKPLDGDSKNTKLIGFDPRIIDNAILTCLSGSIDEGVNDPIVLGALRGLASTYSHKPLYLGPSLVSRLLELTDEFVQTPHRRDLPYKRLLSCLLEAMTGSRVTDYKHIHDWVIATIQENYIVRSLFQREDLHSRVVASVLTLLVRQYQEKVTEYLGTVDRKGGLPDFREGGKTIDLVWKALQEAMIVRKEMSLKHATMYGANLRILTESLLRMEVERLRCAHLLKEVSAPRLTCVLPSVNVEGEWQRKHGADSTAEQVAYSVLHSPNAILNQMKAKVHAPCSLSDDEEQLRVRILSNIVRFLLLPTSIINAIPKGNAQGRQLRGYLVRQCTSVMAIASSMNPNTRVDPYDEHSSYGLHYFFMKNERAAEACEHRCSWSVGDARTTPTPLGLQKQNARLSNWYYHKVSVIARELTQMVISVVEQHHGRISVTAASGSDNAVCALSEPLGAEDGDTIEAAAACLQCMCSNDPIIRSFVHSEVMDAILHVLSQKTDTNRADQSGIKNTRGGCSSKADGYARQMAHRLNYCFNTLTSIVVPMHYCFTHPLKRVELMRYAQLLCDTYEDSLRQVLVANEAKEVGEGKTGPRKSSEANAALEALVISLPTSIMTAAADGYGKLVVRMCERQHAIARDATRQLEEEEDDDGDGNIRAKRARYVKLLNEESEDLMLLIEGAMRCMLNIAWPGSGILYQHPPRGASLGPEAMSELALTCIGQFLKPLCLLFNLLALFPIRSLRDSILGHAEKTRCIVSDDHREEHIHWYVYRSTRVEAATSQSGKSSKEGAATSGVAASRQTRQLRHLSEFRSCWLLLTYYGFASDALTLTKARLCKGDETKSKYGQKGGHLSEVQARHIRLLAISAAPLLQMRSSDMHQATVDIGVLFRYMGSGSGFANDNAPMIHHQFGHILHCICDGKYWWSQLKASELFLMHALTNLEMLRASAGFISNLTLYHYFDAYETVTLPSIRGTLQHIVSASSEIYLNALKTFLPNVAYQLVSKDIRQLVLLMGFSPASVKESARTMLHMIVKAFPAYATCGSGLQLLWSIINLAEYGTTADIVDFCRKVHLSDAPAVLTGVNNDDRRRHLRMLRTEAEWWMREAASKATLALSHTFLRYIEGESVPTGFMLSMNKLSNTSLMTSAPTQQGGMRKKATACQYKLPSFLSSTNYPTIAGENLCGYVQAFIKHNSAKEQMISALRMSPVYVVEAHILEQLCVRVQHRLQVTTASGAVKSLSDAKSMSRVQREAANQLHELDFLMCLAVASMTTGFLSPSGIIHFFRYLVQGPIAIFESDILRAAIGCWSRLLASDCNKFVLPLLIHIAKGVAWTVSRQKGLFDGARPRQSEEVQTGSRTGASTAANIPYVHTYNRNSPHKLLFIFLSDNYLNTEYPWALDRSVLWTLYRMSTHMVEYPSRLSLKDSSFADTMHAAVLLGKVCRTLHDVSIQGQKESLVGMIPRESIGVLRQRWYTCLLQWFQKSRPSWYFTDDLPQALEMMCVLESLIRLLKEEHALLTHSVSGFLSFDAFTASRNSKPAAVSTASDSSLWGMSQAARDHIEVLRLRIDSNDVHNLIEQEQARLLGLLKLLQVLLWHELIRLRVWQTPRRTLRVPNANMISATGVRLDQGVEWSWELLVQVAAQHNPAVLVAMVARFPNLPRVRALASQYVVKTPRRYATISEAVDLYLTKETLDAGAPELLYFASCSIIQTLHLLDKRYVRYPSVTTYAIRSLLAQESDSLIFYLPQILQILAGDENGSIRSFLTRICDKSAMFCHQLLWALQAEGRGDGQFAARCKEMSLAIQARFNEAERVFYTNEFNYITLLTSLSGELMKFEKPQRKPNLQLRLRDAAFHDPIAHQHLYLPTDPTCRIAAVIPETAVALQSAAKCPILIQFRCNRRELEDRRPFASPSHEQEGGEGEGLVVKACIFKMGDDCRQDQLSFQLICLMKRILDVMSVPSFLYPYRVLTTDQDCGIIECVPRSMSRNDIGKLVESNIAEYFVHTFGHPESVGFSRARDNFLKSVASYSVVSYILNTKDRHNGNILIDAEGHVVHIDFGFLFDSSPGGDINFESSPFKLTTEMVQLIGKDVGYKSNLRSSSLAKALVDPDRYNLFKEEVIRCYLAVRQYSTEICTLVELMLHSGLPCFKPQKTIADLKRRLAVSKGEIEAAHFMRCQIHASRENYRTRLYDAYQHFVEGIEM